MFTAAAFRSARRGLLAFVPLLAVFAAACESDATLPNDPDPAGPTTQVTLDATSSSEFVYFNLSTGQQVGVSNPQSAQNWDLALRRYEVRLNGGVAGTAGVTAALVRDNTSESASTLLGYTPEGQLAQFDGVTLSDVPGSAAFSSTDLAATETAWFRPSGSTLAANPGAAWKLRLANGGYALIRVAQLSLNGDAISSLKVEYRLQEGNLLGVLRQLEANPTTESPNVRLSLTDGAVVTSDGCTWDLQVGGDITLTVNPTVSCGAGTFPLESTEDFAALTTASDAPRYAPFLSMMSGPIPNDPSLASHAPFIYGIDPVNPHRLVPSYNVYLVRRGTELYKVQFLSYYNPTSGEAGFLTFRSARLQ